MILPIIVRPCLPGPVPERAVAPLGRSRRGSEHWEGMDADRLSPRLAALPRRSVRGRTVPVADGFRARLLGLAGLPRERAGSGLLIPRCACVHTFGMRFALDLVFLDREDRVLAVLCSVPPRRLVWRRGAASVLELPAGVGGESAPGAA